MARRERILRAAKKKIDYNNNQLSLAEEARYKAQIKKARTGHVAKPKKPIKKT
jgi:hypothetical protein